MIKKISLSKVEHRGQNWLQIKFPFDKEAGEVINEMLNSTWSQTYKSWLFPFEKQSIDSLRQHFDEVAFDDDASRELEIALVPKIEYCKEEDILVWTEQEYIYLKVKSTDLQERSFLSGIELSRNYYGSGYWKIKFSQATAEVLRARYKNRLRKWPSLFGEICDYDEKQRNRNKITAVLSGNQVRVIFDWNKQVINFIKTMPFPRWDATNKWWSYAGSEKTVKALKDFCLQNKYDLRIDDAPVTRRISRRLCDRDDPAYRKCPEKMVDKLLNRRYSESTIKQYCSHFEEFINYHRKVAIEDLGPDEIKQFISFLVQERHVSPSYQNVAVNAIKFYFEKVLGGPRRYIDIDRARRERHLPEVLKREEVLSMISAITNLKHKFIITLLYSTGIRRGELLKLKLKDIDRDNMQIWVRGGKGDKDRYVQLGNNALKILDQYIALFNPRDYLIEGRGEQYSSSSVAQMLKAAALKAGIEKTVTPHKFRHTYATHLLEDGVDKRFIQELMGHASIKTTQIYSHVTDKNIKNIVNPLDRMDI